MKSSPQTGMAGPLILNPDGMEQAGGGVPYRHMEIFCSHLWSVEFSRTLSPPILGFPAASTTATRWSMEIEAVSGSCMLVRCDALLDVGSLDDGYFMHCEDLDWCMRFRQRGWKIIFVPDAHVVHHKGLAAKHGRFLWNAQTQRMMRFYCKFFRHQYPGVLMWIVAAEYG